jgi:hypothetical protein
MVFVDLYVKCQLYGPGGGGSNVFRFVFGGGGSSGKPINKTELYCVDSYINFVTEIDFVPF